MARARGETSRRAEQGARLLVAIYTLATATALLVWLEMRFTARHPSWLEYGFWLLNVPWSDSLTSVVVLLAVTGALLRRKRIALIFAAFFEFLGVLTSVTFFAFLASEDSSFRWLWQPSPFHALNLAAAVVGVVALVWMWTLRPAFPGRLRPGSWLAALATFTTGLSITAAYTWFSLGIVGLATRRNLLIGLITAAGEVDPQTRRYLRQTPDWLSDGTATLLGLTLLITVFVFLRSSKDPNQWTGGREVRLRRLLARFGAQDSLGYFATRRDKSSIFAEGGEAAVSYQVVQGVSLASSDPVGDPTHWQSAIERWLDEARHFGWIPAVVSCSEAGARAYVQAGLRVIKMGDEAVLHPDRFTLSSTSMSAVRQAVSRATKAGLTVQLRRQAELSPEELSELITKADQWRVGAVDRGFSMALNRSGDPADGQTLFVTAHDEIGHVVGLLSFVPWGARNLSLDVMRRSPDAPNGVTELMVAELMARAGDLGVREVSLNFCMFRENFEEQDRFGAGSRRRVQNTLLLRLDRFFQLERLYRSNVKYQPSWRPRFLCHDHSVGLPQAAFAVGIAEGFLPAWLGPRARTGSLSATEIADVEAIETAPPEVPSVRRSDQTRHRIAAAQALAAVGRDPWPVGDGPSRPALAGEVRLTGRVNAQRDHGGVVFAELRDRGVSRQALFDAATLGRDGVREFARLVHLGDLVTVTGTDGVSRNGTPSVLVTGWRMEAKSLHPIPFRAFTDPETRLRQRSTDLIVHPEAAGYLAKRTLVIRSLRRSLDEAGFSEVETPMLHTVHGGASARPFSTHINAYDMDLSLRIAPELYLKRLLVGGLGPLYELGRNFRNEGADNTHNPEFSSLEVYEPGGDYTTMRALTEQLVKEAAIAVHGAPMMPLRPHRDAPPEVTDIGFDWPTIPVLEAVSQAVGRSVTLDTDFDVLLDLARQHEVHVADQMGPGAVIEELYAELVEANTVFPTFYVDFPVETSPLTRPHRRLPGLVERWDLVVNRMELGTAYSELTDPLEQRRRLTEQSLKAAAGDPEAMEVDEDFLFALECGMPPSGGMGMGVDRLVMLLTDTNIRSVLSFPFVRRIG